MKNISNMMAITFILIITSFTCDDNKSKEKDSKNGQTVREDIGIEDNIIIPYLIEKPKVIYPPSARNFGKKGKAIVNVSIGTDGKVFKARTMWSTDKVFEAPAESLAFQYVFKPVIENYKPIAVVVGIPIIFDPDSTK